MLKRLILVSVLTIVLLGWSLPIMADDSGADEQKQELTTEGRKNATPRGPAFLPDLSKVVERPPVKTEPIHNPAGSEMIVAGLTIPVTCDGWIDPAEWSDAYMYDVSDTTGQEDGIPDPLGTVYLWLKQDANGVYFAVRNNADQTLDDYDQVGLYFDDNYDGCWPVSATNEGNNWLVYEAVGSWVQWRWIQDFDCSFPPSYLCDGDDYGGYYNWTPSCFGIGIGPTGNVDFEVMIPYGVIDEYLDLTMPPDTLGFFMYCLDYGPYVWNGEWPSQYYQPTFNEPCYFGRLICGGEQEWPNHKMHFPQLPDLEGWDVYAVAPKTLADDWQCSATGPVLDIHFWGSWKDVDGDPYTDDFTTPMPWFGLSIHRNIPASADTPYSRPGEQIWWWDGEIQGVPSEPPSMEHWFNPNTGEVLYNDHVPYWRYDFFFDQAYPVPDPFFQYKDSIYWLNVAVHPDVCPPPYAWGWKSSRDHFMDDAVYTDNPPDGPWIEMYEPPRANWFDVYFNSDGTPEDMGSTNYYGGGWYQYEYWWNMWFYNNPFVHQPKHIWLEFYVEFPYPHSYAEFAINWSTDLWSLEGEPGRPPLPGDDETLYIGREIFTVVDGFNTIDFWIDDYNPEWVSIDFVATDVVINGWIWHECVQTSMDMAFVITGEEVPTGPNHYKTWVFAPLTLDSTVFVQDQFMEDSLYLLNSVLLSNPVKKVVENDTFDIIRPDDHLTWYRAFGRDTLLEVEYVNQFESTTVVIDIVEWLLVPTQKEDHAPPENLDHYKAYNIQNPAQFPAVFSLEDQFDIRFGAPEFIDYITPTYFLTPAIKNMEHPQMFDSVTHYVAYEIFPRRSFPLTVYSWDQFGEHYLTVLDSWYLLVPSTKRIAPPCYPPNIGCPSDETQNANGVYTTTTQWSADDGNPTDPTVELISVAVQPPLPPGISAAVVNFAGPVPGPGLGVKATWGTVTYTVADHCQSGGNITLITTNSCPPPNNSATCPFNVTLTNDPPDITQPDSLEGLANDVVEYDISGNDPNGDIINDTASIQIEPDCGTYWITRTSGSGTSSGTWHINWNTSGCTACITHLVIHDLTDACGATSYCTTKVHLSEEPGWVWKDAYEDYAINGMPDIDQRQDGWQKAETQQFSFCGPCAVANCFKWFDSKYNQPPGAPGDGLDQFPLVRDYLDALAPFIPPATDDHDPWNVDHAATPWLFGATPPPPATPQPFVPGPQPQPSGMPPWGELVERLAWYFNTDGIQSGYCEFTGTNIMDMQAGIDAWLRSETFTDGSSLFDTLCEVTTAMPTFAYVESLVEKCEDVILLLGFWYYDAPQEFIRGDIDADGSITALDLGRLMEGPPFLCDDAVDVNDDGALNDLDSTYLWDFYFAGGDYPPPPYPDCGLDPTTDALGCAEFPFCPPTTGEWRRIGGHYVTVAGVNSERSMIAFSDPFVDAAEMGFAPGRVGDGYLIPHPHGSHDPTIHNDEGNVCHDMYAAVPSPSPGGLWGLPEYPIMADPYNWSWNFYNQNVPVEFMPVTAPWNEASAIFTEVEYCVHISPWDYRGDCTGDGIVDVADVLCILNYLFLGASPPDPLYVADTNCDGVVDVADAVNLINYLFTGTAAPRCCDP